MNNNTFTLCPSRQKLWNSLSVLAKKVYLTEKDRWQERDQSKEFQDWHGVEHFLRFRSNTITYNPNENTLIQCRIMAMASNVKLIYEVFDFRKKYSIERF